MSNLHFVTDTQKRYSKGVNSHRSRGWNRDLKYNAGFLQVSVTVSRDLRVRPRCPDQTASRKHPNCTVFNRSRYAASTPTTIFLTTFASLTATNDNL